MAASFDLFRCTPSAIQPEPAEYINFDGEPRKVRFWGEQNFNELENGSYDEQNA